MPKKWFQNHWDILMLKSTLLRKIKKISSANTILNKDFEQTIKIF